MPLPAQSSTLNFDGIAKAPAATTPLGLDFTGIAKAPAKPSPLAAALGQQLQRTDLPDDVRAQLERMQTTHAEDPDLLLQQVTDLAKGAKAGLLTSAYHGGDLIRRGVAHLVSPDVLSTHPQLASFLGLGRVINHPDVQAAMTAPASIPGKVGKLAEQTAEFVAPANAITDVARSTQIMRRLVSAGVSLPRARLAAGLAEGVAQGGAAAGLTKLHGDPGATVVGVISAAAPVASAALENAYPAIKAMAVAGLQKLLAKVYAPEDLTARATRLTTQAASDVLDAPIQWTWEKWRQATARVRGVAGHDLTTALAGPLGDTPVPKQPILDALDDLVATQAQHLSVQPIAPAGHLAGKTVTYNPPLVSAVEDLKATLAQYPADIPARQLHDIKQTWADAVFPRKDARNPIASIAEQLTTAQKEARMRGIATIRTVLDAHAPQIADLDTATSHAIQLNQLVKRLQKKAPISKTAELALQTASAVSGAAVGQGLVPGPGSVLGSWLGWSTSRLVQVAMESPAWLTAGPHLKNELAEAIAAGTTRRVQRLLTPLFAAGATQAAGAVQSESMTREDAAANASR